MPMATEGTKFNFFYFLFFCNLMASTLEGEDREP
jgi:hypothetical protein